MDYVLSLATDPAAWAALATLIVMEVVLGIDNLLFISIVTNRLPEHQRKRARRIGIGLALILRLALLATIAYIVGLKSTVISPFGVALSWRDLIMIAGGLFLVWKATHEIHRTTDPEPAPGPLGAKQASESFGSAIGQILLLDLVFSIDSIITAVGMADHVLIMIVAVVVAVGVMMVAATPLANFINKNPTVVMLALGFLLLIGTTLIADGFGVHVPKGYIYAAMAFSGFVEGLNMLQRRRRKSTSSTPDAA